VAANRQIANQKTLRHLLAVAEQSLSMGRAVEITFND
jgi:hypothetical protein